MKKQSKLLALLLACAMTLALSACGGSSATTSTPASSAAPSASGSAAATGDKTYTIGICQLVQHNALDAATKGFKDALTEKLGDKVKFVEQNAAGDSATCATICNQFVSSKVDLIMANATPALQAATAATNSIPILGTSVTDYTFIIPLNIYSHKVKAISDIKDGDVVAIPDDVTNGGRAIKVLAAAGLITLKEDAGFNPTLEDIKTYNTKITIKELKANTIPSVLDDVTAAVVNGNYALDFGLKTEEAIYKDSVLDEEKYWNLIAARTEDLQDKDKVAVYQKVVKAFQSDATEKVFNDTFGGYFIKVGWDQDLLASK